MDGENKRERARARLKAIRNYAKRQRTGEAVNHRVSDSEPSSENSSQSSQATATQHSDDDVGMDEEQAKNPNEYETEEKSSNEEEAGSNSESQQEMGESDAEDHEGVGNDTDGSNGSVDSDGAESEDLDYDARSDSERSESEQSGSDVESEREEMDSSDEEEDNNYDGNNLIYPGARITLHESLLAIFSLICVANLSGKLISNILQLIALHCPEGNILKKTLATFKSYFSKLGETMIVLHYFCSNCIYPLKTKNSECPKCKKNDQVSYFLELPLLQQLQNLFKRENFYNDLQFRFKADRKKNKDNIEDIYDASVYKEQIDNGFLKDPRNISFMWYSDGISIFKSSRFSVWPMCLVINELPFKMRTLPKNILLVGLWFGKSKPNPNIFLKPLYKTMKKFEKDGHMFRLFDNTEVLVKGKLLCGTCDMPAKSKFLNIKQYNAYYGCPKCMAKGGRAVAGNTTVQVYPYQANTAKRTHAQTVDFASQALEARKTNKDASVFGVKGPTLLAKMVPDIIKCTGIDIMHGVFLGVFKMLLDLWLSSHYSGRPWSVHHLYDFLDEKLCKLKSPSFAERAPRSLKDLKFWKASEYKQFMLYYSVPLLKNVLEDVYFKHHCVLVSAISLLSQDSISLAQIQAASALLISYVSDFVRLYPVRYLGINVHQLLHLPDVTLELGPSWVYSCYFLESFNGVLNKMFHGTQHVALQICSTVSMMVKIPEFKSHLAPDSIVREFCEHIEQGSKRVKVADVIDGNTCAVGKYSYDWESVQHSTQAVIHCLEKEDGTCSVFYRLKKKDVLYFSEEYPRKSLRKESSFITFLEDGNVRVGRIIRFVRWSNCGNVCENDCRDCPADYIAVVRIYERQHWFIHDMRNIRISHLSKVEETENITAIDVQFILGLCFYFEADTVQYIATLVNRLERE